MAQGASIGRNVFFMKKKPLEIDLEMKTKCSSMISIQTSSNYKMLRQFRTLPLALAKRIVQLG